MKLLNKNMEWFYTDLIDWNDSDEIIPNVIHLDISNQNLTTLPPKIFKLTFLQTFYCHNNKLTELPKEIKLLTSLRIISCKNNKLTTLPKELCEIHSLETLWCTKNPLNIHLVSHMNNLIKVKEYFETEELM